MRPSSAGELPPLERTGSPTGAEKDILVNVVVARENYYDSTASSHGRLLNSLLAS